MALQQSIKTRTRHLGTPGLNSTRTLKRLKTMLEQSPNQADAQAFVAAVKPLIENNILDRSDLASITLQVAAAKDKSHPELSVHLRRNPDSDDLSAIANHLTLWLRGTAKAPNASVIVRRQRKHAANDLYLITANLAGE